MEKFYIAMHACKQTWLQAVFVLLLVGSWCGLAHWEFSVFERMQTDATSHQCEIRYVCNSL